MKTFFELTGIQQAEAIEFAERTMRESLSLGILSTSEFLDEQDIHTLAVVAAEGGEYNDEGKPTMDKVEVPFRFFGGCV